jgi:lactate permease
LANDPNRASQSRPVLQQIIDPVNVGETHRLPLTDLKGQEGVVFARTFKHSIVLTVLLGILVVFQQYVAPWMIP